MIIANARTGNHDSPLAPKIRVARWLAVVCGCGVLSNGSVSSHKRQSPFRAANPFAAPLAFKDDVRPRPDTGIDLKGTLSRMSEGNDSDFRLFDIMPMAVSTFASVRTFSGRVSGEPCDSVNRIDSMWIISEPRHIVKSPLLELPFLPIPLHTSVRRNAKGRNPLLVQARIRRLRLPLLHLKPQSSLFSFVWLWWNRRVGIVSIQRIASLQFLVVRLGQGCVPPPVSQPDESLSPCGQSSVQGL